MDSTRDLVGEAPAPAPEAAVLNLAEARGKAKARAVQQQAAAAARRILGKVPPPRGTKTKLQLIEHVEEVMNHPARYGITLTKRDIKCLKLVHTLHRIEMDDATKPAPAEVQTQAEEAGESLREERDKPGDVVPIKP